MVEERKIPFPRTDLLFRRTSNLADEMSFGAVGLVSGSLQGAIRRPKSMRDSCLPRRPSSTAHFAQWSTHTVWLEEGPEMKEAQLRIDRASSYQVQSAVVLDRRGCARVKQQHK